MSGAAEPPDASARPELVRCQACRMLLARRWPSGRIEVVVRGDTIEDGRVVIACPDCGRRVRIPVRRPRRAH